jgi:hypothetical protein
MKVFLEQSEVIEAVTQWLQQRGITTSGMTFDITNNGPQHRKILETTVWVSDIEVKKDGPYR